MVQAQFQTSDNVPQRLFIEGIAVDRLFESVYSEFRDIAACAGTRLHFEVIAWDTLVAAADRHALREVHRAAVQSVLDEAPGGKITLRAYSHLDDVCVMFEILVESAGDRDVTWDRSIDRLRDLIEHMGGEIATFHSEDAGSGLHFWLPQWIGAADERLVA